VMENACCTPDASVSNAADVMAWRRRRLLGGGFEESMATALAGTPGVDLHALLNLVDRGCPPETAIRILGPFGDAVPSADAP
jgi:hypothetical protein